ncbi:MAG: LysE/ArgO family amino acid transporter [Pseudomonadota bacterium]
MNFLLSSFFEGFGIGMSLIIPIGLQNAFVLKQGILKNHVFIIALFCSLSDAILIIAGVNGLGVILSQNQFILESFFFGGVIFIFAYGTKSFIDSLKKHSLKIDDQPNNIGLKRTFKTLFIVSFLNPHLYLDSCIFMASITSLFSVDKKISFTIGACLASFIWFFTLGFGARYLKKFFTNPKAWKILDFIIGCVMYTVGISLIIKKL